MTQFNFKEQDAKLKKDFIERHPTSVENVKQDIINTSKFISEEVDLTRWNRVITDLDKTSADIYYYLASMQTTMPVESLIGAVAGLLNPTKDKTVAVVYDVHQTAAEIIMASKLILKTLSYTNKTIVQSTLSNKELDVTEMYPLPSHEPTENHKTLGRYNWSNTNTEALDKLNNLAFTLLDIEEQEPLKSANITDPNEQHSKWRVRKELRPKLAGKAVFFDWHACYRGRSYAGGYHFNPQGTEGEKSIIAFHNKEEVTDEGIYQLKLAIARAYGFDKKTDEWKLNWYTENEHQLNALIPKEKETAKKLDLAMKQYLNTGETSIPVELDATNSQLQVIAVLTGDYQTASTCNVVLTQDGSIADAYQDMADTMSRLAAERNIKGSSLDHMHTADIEAGAISDTETARTLDNTKL